MSDQANVRCTCPVLLKMGKNGDEILFCICCGKIWDQGRDRQVINQWELKQWWDRARTSKPDQE